MVGKPTHYFVKGQLWFCACVLACVLLLPEGLTANAGISYYSAHLRTIVPYVAGLLFVTWFSYQAAELLPKRGNFGLRYWMKGLAALTVIVAVVPFAVSPTLEAWHVGLSATLFIAEQMFILWIALKVRRDIVNAGLLILSITAIVITLSYINPVAGYLIAGELSFQLIFAVTLYRALRSFDAAPEHSLRVAEAAAR